MSVPVRLLRGLLRFDPWHINHGRPSPYIAAGALLARPVLQERGGVVVDVGCGLGTFLRHLDQDGHEAALQRVGYDTDPRVLRAAAILSYRQSIVFRVGTLADVSQTVPHVRLLSCLNWPHRVPPASLREQFANLVRAVPVDYLLADSVPSPPYDWHHDWRDVCPNATLVRTVRGFEYGRALHLLSLTS